jgi:hypothetical protein
MSTRIRTLETTMWNSAKLLTDAVSDTIGADKGVWRVAAGLGQAIGYGELAFLGGKEFANSVSKDARELMDGQWGNALLHGIFYDIPVGVGTIVSAGLVPAALRSGFVNDNEKAAAGKVG